MARIKKPTIKLVVRKTKVLLNGENQIFLRITFNRKSKYYVLKGDQGTLSCEYKKWNSELGRYKRNREFNYFLESYEQRANVVLREFENKEFSFHLFETKYFKKYENTKIV